MRQDKIPNEQNLSHICKEYMFISFDTWGRLWQIMGFRAKADLAYWDRRERHTIWRSDHKQGIGPEFLVLTKAK